MARHSDGGLIGDTLRVFVDLSSLKAGVPKAVTADADWSIQGAVEATIECVLTTAAMSKEGYDPKTRTRVSANYVDLRVKGAAEYAHYAGVFSFKSLGTLPRKRQFE